MSSTVKQFTDNLIPGNYWITKSMEFTKLQSSGTLWYLKKWIVFYKFIFLNKELHQENYLEITQIFNNFIQSLPPEVQPEAKEFFFKVDIRNPSKFTSLQQFLSNQPDFENKKEKQNFILSAKKFYFVYIMSIGGQAGFKKKIKDKIEEGANYLSTCEYIKNVIQNDLSGKSQEAIDKKFNEQIADFHAALRNERQIFFYYGFFHGKESSDLLGFYRLTPIGKGILSANFHEMLIIWELQKIKMVSQSSNTVIDNLEITNHGVYKKFNTNPHPYINLLEILYKNESITKEHYKYVISRMGADEINFVADNLEAICLKSKDIIKAIAKKRSGDDKDEDFSKELKKFVLGIDSNMEKDSGLNYFAFVNLDRQLLKINNQQKAKFIVDIYKRIKFFLDESYRNIYDNTEYELKNQYRSKTESEFFYQPNFSKTYDWNKYLINYERSILLNLIFLSISLRATNFDFSIAKNNFKDFFQDYKSILISAGFSFSPKQFTERMFDIQLELSNNGLYSEILDEYEYLDPKEFSDIVSLEKIQEESEKSIELTQKRERNTTLIKDLRTFYFNNYIDNGDLACDCCQEATFKKDNGMPYIEFHHLIPFRTDNGPDHYLNLFGLCPNCHRKMHFLNYHEKTELYNQLSINNNLKKSIIERIELLIKESRLEPIHLEFLLKENIIKLDEYNKYMSFELAA